MTLTEKQWQYLAYALETRSYRYFDTDEYEGTDEMKLFLSLQKQVLSNKIKQNGKVASLRFSEDKKDYLQDMVSERIFTEEESGMIDQEYVDTLYEVLKLIEK